MVAACLRGLAAAEAPQRIAIALSGGGDSAALLALSAAARDRIAAQGAPPPALIALTVDHGLRPGSAEDAAQAAALADRFGAEAHVLTWDRAGAPAGNLQSAARAARYRLMADWRAQAGVGPLLLGHTRDDVAETFLLRLARGSGVDGLAAMAADVFEEPAAAAKDAERPRLRLARPLLSVDRETLRVLLRSLDAPWSEDPSNADLRFERVRMRDAAPALAALGLTAERLAKTARSLARARAALESATAAAAARVARVDRAGGWVALDAAALAREPEEIALRLLARSLEWTAGAAYPPRLEALEAALAAALQPGGAARRTLHGCLVARGRAGWLTVAREPAAAAGPLRLEPGARCLWDGRFEVCAGEQAIEVAALGAAEARSLAPDVRRAAPGAALAALPALLAPGGGWITPLDPGAVGAGGARLAPRRPLSWAGGRARES